MSNDVATRGDDGRFLPGQSGNPAGRPKGKRNQITELKQDLEIALREQVRPREIQKIIDKMTDLAAEGNVGAAKLILDKVLSNARDTEDAQDNSGGFTFVVKNLTLQNHEAPEEGNNIIDVTPEEV